MAGKNIYSGGALDSEKTSVFLKRHAFKRCPYCNSKPQFHYIHMFSPIFKDGQVWCDWCSSYLGMWEEEVEKLHARY